MIDDRCCATCINWLQSDAVPSFNAEAVGECHRYAPRPRMGAAETIMVCWPLTRESEACGEWYFGQERAPVSAEDQPADETRPTTEMPLADTVGEDD